MSESEAILRRVEVLREQLNLMIKSKALTDSEILALSRQLDQTLNEYWQAKQALPGRRQA